jgi:hypothetical protein
MGSPLIAKYPTPKTTAPSGSHKSNRAVVVATTSKKSTPAARAPFAKGKK